MKKCVFTYVLGSMMILAAFVPTAAQADIYKYVDAEGVIHLTNVPAKSDTRYEMILKERRVLLKVRSEDITKYDQLINQASEKYNIDSALVKAVIKAESNFNHKAVSPKGARGLMQLMPATASSLQVRDSFHPEKNIDGGVRYLRYLLNVFKGDLTLALAAYNAGEAAVARYHYSIPPFQETQTYVRRVMQYLAQYRNEKQ